MDELAYLTDKAREALLLKNFAITLECLNLAIETIAKMQTQCCVWKYDRESDFYEGECGNSFMLSNEDGLEANEIIHCPKCGLKIKVNRGVVQ